MIVLTDKPHNDRLFTEYIRTCERTRDFTRLEESHLSEGMKEVFEFAKDLAKNMKVKLSSIITLLKNSEVFRFFQEFKFDWKRIVDAFNKASKAYSKIVNFLPDLATDLAQLGLGEIGKTQLGSKAKETSIVVNNWIKKHKTVLMVSGAVLAILLIVIWFNMSYIGDPDYDFDFSDVLNALLGKMTLIDFLSSREGIKSIVLLATGVLGLNPFKYFGTGVDIAISLTRTIAHWVKVGIVKGSDSSQAQLSLQNSLI